MSQGVIESLERRICSLERQAQRKPTNRVERYATITKLSAIFGVSRSVMSEAISAAVATRKIKPVQFNGNARKMYSVDEVARVMISEY